MHITEQMEAAAKEMTIRVAEAIRLRPVDINVTKEEFCHFFEDMCARPEFIAEESVIFKDKVRIQNLHVLEMLRFHA